MRRISPKKPAIGRHNREDTSPNTSTKEADERRLRKLKGFLKSVSYNGSEGMQFETLNDLYSDSLLPDRSPCTDLLTLGEFKCNPTPFLVSSCFNKTQVNTNTKGKLRNSRKPVRKTTPNRGRKIIPTPNKNANSLAEIYGKMEVKARQVKSPSKKHGISKGKVGSVGCSQGRRSTLDAAVETAVQSGKSQTWIMKDAEDETKKEKEIKKDHKSPKQEAAEKKKVQECTKEKDGVDKMKQQTKTENSGNSKDSLKTKKEMTDKNKEDKLKQETTRKEQDQKMSDTKHPSTSGKSGKKDGDREMSKSGKSTKESNTANIRSVTGKTSFAESQINAAKNSLSKTKKQDFEKSPKSESMAKPHTSLAKPNTSGSHEEEKQPHLKGTKSSDASPVVASTSTENKSPRTRLRAKSKTNDGRQLRLRRERPLTYSPNKSASPDKGSNKDTGHGYSIRRRNLRKTNTR